MMQEQRIRTARMELIAGSGPLLKAESEGRASLAAALGAEVPGEWPPENWEDAVEQFLIRLERHPGLAGWLNWYWVLEREGKRVLIGSGGFTGAPFNGGAMIGYSVIGPYRGRGYGPEAVQALLNWAFARPGVQHILAETLSDNGASVGLLEKCGFEYAGKGFEKGTIRYIIPAEKWFLLKANGSTN